MTNAKELCLAIVEYFINFLNKRFLVLVPSPPIEVISLFKFLLIYLNFSKRRNDVSNGLKIMKLTSRFKDIRKVFPINKRDFLALRGHMT